MPKLSKVELLKIFTQIPSDFIDDFFDIFSRNKDTSFTINLDIVAKWLHARKDELFATLKRSYVENVDYTVRNARSQKGGNRYKLVMLSINCFKRLCMRSRSKKAEDVRTYFIELDDFISHYSDQISEYCT